GRLASLLAGWRGDQSGEIHSLDGAALAAVWQQYTREGAPPRSLRPAQLLAWNAEQADISERQEDRFGAAWHLSRLIQAKAADMALRFRRGRAYAWLGSARSALVDLDRAQAVAGSAAFYTARGRVLAQLGLLDRALADLNELVKRAPGDG